MQKNEWSIRQKNGNHPITTVDRKTNEKTECNVWYLWDNIKLAKLHITGAPEGPEREKGIKNVFEKIYGWKLPKLKEGNRYIQVREIQQVPNKMNPNTHQEWS